MTISTHDMDAFLALLNEKGIPYRPKGAGLRVLGSLYLEGTSIQVLPDDLTVTGYLNLEKSAVAQLPERLTIGQGLGLEGTAYTIPDSLCMDGSLYMEGSQVTSLPEGFSVGGTLDITNSYVTALPNGLCVGEDLKATGTDIAHLPENLQVGGSLEIQDTPITRLPAGMNVGNMIYPTHHLHDIVAFMQTQDAPVVLSLPTSQHEHLYLRHQIQAFPDLLRVVLALQNNLKLHLDRHERGKIVCTLIMDEMVFDFS